MKKAAITVGLLLLAACTSTYQPPAARVVEKSSALAEPAEQVWQSVIRYFGENNIPIENLDHSSFFIKTKPVDLTLTYAAPTYAGKKIPLRNQWCDCGDAKLANVWSTSQEILLSFNIVLRPITPSSTNVTINVFFDGTKLGKRNAYARGYDIRMKLRCVSTGRLEHELLAYLSRQSRKS